MRIVACIGCLEPSTCPWTADPEKPGDYANQLNVGKLPGFAGAIGAWLPPAAADFEVDFSRATRRRLAYAIFTSGSTGNPTGVPSAHAGMLSHTRRVEEVLSLACEDVFLQAAVALPLRWRPRRREQEGWSPSKRE